MPPKRGKTVGGHFVYPAAILEPPISWPKMGTLRLSLLSDHRKVKFPHRGHHKAIALAMAKSPLQSDFIVIRSDRYVRHHCTRKEQDSSKKGRDGML